jgi:hypothetical protein
MTSQQNRAFPGFVRLVFLQGWASRNEGRLELLRSVHSGQCAIEGPEWYPSGK